MGGTPRSPSICANRAAAARPSATAPRIWSGRDSIRIGARIRFRGRNRRPRRTMGRLTRVLLAGFACPAKRQPISRSVFLYIALVALSMSDTESYSYAKAGVDIAAGNALVRAIAPLANDRKSVV